MTSVLVDTSVVIKWFHEKGEADLDAARALLDAHADGRIDAHIIDLGLYEIGNVLARPLGWAASDISDQLDAVVEIVGPPIAPDSNALRRAADLAVEHRLSFYDAAWAATAEHLGIPLVSADRRLVEAGLAESPHRSVERLGLR